MSMKSNSCFAEVIESSLSYWLAQCWQWDKPPHFGSLVTIEQPPRTIFGLVYQVKMGSMDPMRYPFPYQKTEQELRAEQPQIFEFLKTTFSCICVGYKQAATISYLQTPEPPKIHAFVAQSSQDHYKEFFSSTRYLPLLFNNASQIGALDELLLALFKHQQELGLLTKERFNESMQVFSLLTGNDYRRLKLFLQRVSPSITQ